MELLHKKGKHDKNCDNLELLYCIFLKYVNIIIITLVELHNCDSYCYYHWTELVKVTLWLHVRKSGWNFTASCLTTWKIIAAFFSGYKLPPSGLPTADKLLIILLICSLWLIWAVPSFYTSEHCCVDECKQALWSVDIFKSSQQKTA